MPILECPPEADRAAMSHHVAAQRRCAVSGVGAAAPPPEDLLPSGGTHRAPVADPDRAWSDVTFRERVGAIRQQLAPLRSRAALVESYGREASHVTVDGRAPGGESTPATPLQVAYAIRWLELAEPLPLTPIARTDLLDGPLE
ncbi:MAG: hypothetical protein WEG56_14685 [Chloroflexota bacterium]